MAEIDLIPFNALSDMVGKKILFSVEAGEEGIGKFHDVFYAEIKEWNPSHITVDHIKVTIAETLSAVIQIRRMDKGSFWAYRFFEPFSTEFLSGNSLVE